MGRYRTYLQVTGSDLEIIQHTNSVFNSNSYILVKEYDCWIIDVGDCDEILKIIKGLSLKGIFLTHIHYDHIYGLNKLIEVIRESKVYTNSYGKKALMDSTANLSFFHDDPFIFSSPEKIVQVCNRQIIPLTAGISAEAIFTPGHNPSCISWIINDSFFTGDSYIPGVNPVTKLPEGDITDAINSKELILSFANGKRIYPGHTV